MNIKRVILAIKSALMIVGAFTISGCVMPGYVSSIHPTFKADVANAQYTNNINPRPHFSCNNETFTPSSVRFETSGVLIRVGGAPWSPDLKGPGCISPSDSSGHVAVEVRIHGADTPIDATHIVIRTSDGQSLHPYESKTGGYLYGDDPASLWKENVGLYSVHFLMTCPSVEGAEITIAGLRASGAPVTIPSIHMAWGTDTGGPLCAFD